MVKYKQRQLDALFSALSDATRRSMIERLSDTSLTASELAQAYRISFPAVSKHLKVLRQARIVTSVRRGRQHIFSINAGQLEQAREWMEHWAHYWNHQFDNLEKFLKNN
jgi:DNA-binding transcriptional ArsR family regulator